MKNFGEKGAWVYPGTAQMFWVPPTISGTRKATKFTFGRCIHRVHPNKSPLKFGRKGSMGVSRDCPNFLSTPIISGSGKATNFKFGRCIPSVHANKSPSLKYLGEKGAWAYPRTDQFFWVGLAAIISGTGKATNVKFGRYIHRVHANKSPLKGSVGVSNDCRNFFSTPYYRRNG